MTIQQPQYSPQGQPMYEQQQPQSRGWGCGTWIVIALVIVVLGLISVAIDPHKRQPKFFASGASLLVCTPRELHGCRVLYTRADGTVAVFDPGLIEASSACERDVQTAATIMRATAVSRCGASSQDLNSEAQCLMRFGIFTAPAESAGQRTFRSAPPHGGASLRCNETEHSGEFEGFLPL